MATKRTIDEMRLNLNPADIMRVTDVKIQEAVKKAEEWIWVEGYKGTDKNMCCRDQQYEIGKQVDLPEDQEVKECEAGYHLCLKLSDVFDYYQIGNGNRYFKVRALVRKSDIEKYGKSEKHPVFAWMSTKKDKLAAKSIEFIRECSIDEIFENVSWAKDYTAEEKRLAIKLDRSVVEQFRRKNKLMALGYSEAFANYVSRKIDWTERAIALDSVPGLSIDAKILSIFVDED